MLARIDNRCQIILVYHKTDLSKPSDLAQVVNELLLG
jgi:hypothetical protein